MACGCGSDRQPVALLDSAYAPASGVLLPVYGTIHKHSGRMQVGQNVAACAAEHGSRTSGQ
jgi:hypothetical protein